MHGVTTAIVGFIFVCIIWPKLVKNRPQFYAALTLVLLVILLDAVGHMINAPAFFRFVYVMVGLAQVAAILLLVLCAGGVTPRQLAGEMAHAYEVIRRGEEQKEVIIPIGAQARQRPDPPPPAPPQNDDLNFPSV